MVGAPFFQHYLVSAGRARPSPRTRHAHLSALVVYHLGRHILGPAAQQEPGDETLLLFATLAVFRHHGDLADLAEDWAHFVSASRCDAEVLSEQWEAVDRQGLRVYASGLLRDLQVDDSWAPPPARELTLVDEPLRLRRLPERLKVSGLRDAFALRHLFSLLIGCDKLDAALYGAVPARKTELCAGIVEDYRRDHLQGRGGRLAPLRNQVFMEVKETLDGCSHTGGLFTLTAPTGAGKTIALLWAGLELRRRAAVSREEPPRIVYSLPFTSIIDQNFEVFRDVLQKSGMTGIDKALARHHHLAQPRFDSESAQYAEAQAELLVETWQPEIVVTTFHQLLYGLFGQRNSDAKRFFRAAGGVLLLDEVQAIPRRYWELVRDTLALLAERYGTTVILATATRPLILDGVPTRELCPGHERHFAGLDRVRLRCNLAERTPLTEFAGRLLDEVRESCADVLVVCNTIASARYLHGRLRETLPPEELFYLSTHVTPLDRLERLRRLGKRGTRRVLVSTQLIEAGVDLSFGRVYRDLAPLDCVIQAAGRCNRSAELDAGAVELLWLVDDTKPRPWEPCSVYDPLLLEATRRSVPTLGEVPESAFLELTRHYFDEVRRTTCSSELEQALGRMQNGTVGESFRLIADHGPAQSYFVVRDDEDRRLWERYVQVSDLADRRERRAAFLAIKSQFQLRSIDVRKPKGHPVSDHVVLPLFADGGPEGRYDAETGFNDAEGGTYAL
ncbi:MAG: CRISPR-associated helicase Cas3' [Candidatus Wallbacteria bacterium]|nr:CRISPR-associated helicase Cas3' [Candidatus Wallbacteria bacterium]